MRKFFGNDIASLVDVFNKLRYILSKKQKYIGIIVLIMTIIGAALETLGVSIIVPLVQSFLSADQLMQNTYIRPIVKLLNITTSRQLIIWLSVMVIVIYILKNIYMVLLSYVRIKFSVKVKRELSIKMMHAYMEREFAYFLGVNTADILRGVGYDVSGVQGILFQLFRIMADGLTAVCICAYIVKANLSMALSIVILMGISLGLLIIVFRSKMKKIGDYYRECTVKVNKYLYESFQGIKDVLVFRREDYFINKYEVSFSNQQKAEVMRTLATESPAYFIEAVFISGLIIVVGIKIIAGGNTAAFIPQLAAFAMAAFRILPSIGKISAGFNELICACPALNATYANLKEVESFKKESRVQRQNIEGEGKLFEKEIVIKNLYWKYANMPDYVIRNLELTIPKGKSIALIGESGAGKSTLADILLGLLIPNQGDIEVDGISIYHMMDSWKGMIGYVPQTVFLTDDTIRHNIAFGIDDKDIDESKIRKAVEKAQLMNTISHLPEGLNTVLGERGTRFSGGQRQRVAIARALYNDPEILVLDEATAALDNDTENAVMEAIDALQGYKTLIIIAHRLTTIRNCDVIYEIREGKAYKKEKGMLFSDD